MVNEVHPNVRTIQKFFAAYAAKNVDAVREVMANDIVWRVPGHHPLSGVKTGIREVLAFFDQLAKAGFKAEPKALAVDGDYVLDYHRGWSEAGTKLDLMWVLVFRFEAGKIKEVTNFCSDQHAADAFMGGLSL